MFFTGSRSGVMFQDVPFQSTRSALAPGAIRPRSSRPRARAPPSVAASKTSAAGVAHDLDVARRVVGPGGAADDQRVAEDHAGPEEAELPHPGDRRLAVPGQ